MDSFTRKRPPHQIFHALLCIYLIILTYIIIELLVKEQTGSDTALVDLADLIDHLDSVDLTNIAISAQEPSLEPA